MGVNKQVIWVMTTPEVWSRLWISLVISRRNFKNIKRLHSLKMEQVVTLAVSKTSDWAEFVRFNPKQKDLGASITVPFYRNLWKSESTRCPLAESSTRRRSTVAGDTSRCAWDASCEASGESAAK
jgi:hypothetical protein